jgi:hypothetical protein
MAPPQALPAQDDRPGTSGPGDSQLWTVLDDLPKPTEQMVADSSGDSNATTRQATAAHDGTQDRGALAHRPAPWPELIRMRSLGANVGAIRANDFPRKANRYGQAVGDHASLRTDPDDAERLTGIYGSEGWGFESLRARSKMQVSAL